MCTESQTKTQTQTKTKTQTQIRRETMDKAHKNKFKKRISKARRRGAISKKLANAGLNYVAEGTPTCCEECSPGLFRDGEHYSYREQQMEKRPTLRATIASYRKELRVIINPRLIPFGLHRHFFCGRHSFLNDREFWETKYMPYNLSESYGCGYPQALEALQYAAPFFYKKDVTSEDVGGVERQKIVEPMDFNQRLVAASVALFDVREDIKKEVVEVRKKLKEELDETWEEEDEEDADLVSVFVQAVLLSREIDLQKVYSTLPSAMKFLAKDEADDFIQFAEEAKVKAEMKVEENRIASEERIKQIEQKLRNGIESRETEEELKRDLELAKRLAIRQKWAKTDKKGKVWKKMGKKWARISLRLSMTRKHTGEPVYTPKISNAYMVDDEDFEPDFDEV